MTQLAVWLLFSVFPVISPNTEYRIPTVVSVTSPSTDYRLPSTGQAAQPAVRFHHVHYRVGDPSAAISHTAATLKGERVIVPGIGVGVRAGDEYLIFDRLDETDPSSMEQMPLAEAYRAAVAWLGRQGVTVAPVGAASELLLTALPGEPYDHVAFAANDFDEVAQRLTGTDTTVIRRTGEAVVVDAGNGLRVELVRETGREDTFWCPMHPDVRSPDGGACHVCGMNLVPIPPPKVGEYRLDVAQVPNSPGGGLSGLKLTVRDPDSNAVVKDFLTVHERVFHLFIVGRDLEYFEHVHPEPAAGGSFVLTQAIPPGEYMLIADFLPRGGTTQMVQRALIVAGTASAEPRVVTTHAVRITMQTEDFTAGKYACLTFTVTDVKTGQPVTDLEPYLGAPAHMLLVRADLTDAVHAHPEEIATGGPVVSFHPLIPAAGDYKLWVQFQRAGRVITVPFLLRAER